MIVNGESGLLFAPGDEDAFVSAVSRLVEDAAGRNAMARAGRRRAEERYSVEAMIDEYAGFYGDLAGDDRGTGRSARCA
jgi:glycosyltransferase involved in cell wall biosynthesis